MQYLDNITGIEARIVALRAKLKARSNKKEFKKNCDEIRVEIDNLEQRLFAMKHAREAAVASNSEPGE